MREEEEEEEEEDRAYRFSRREDHVSWAKVKF